MPRRRRPNEAPGRLAGAGVGARTLTAQCCARLGAPGPDFGTWDSTKPDGNVQIQTVAEPGKRKAKLCYNDLALSCLAVSGGLPFFIWHLCLAQISPSPYSVTTRVSPWAPCHDLEQVRQSSFAARSRLTNPGIAADSGSREEWSRPAYVPPGVPVACGSPGPGRSRECRRPVQGDFSVLPYAYR
jgi:hypothetical protein